MSFVSTHTHTYSIIMIYTFSLILGILVISGQSITEYHRLGGLSTVEIYFSQFWGWESPRTSHRQVQCWRRTRLLVGRWPSSRCVLRGRRNGGAPWGLCYKDFHPFLGAQPYISHHFQKTTPSRTITLWFQPWNLEVSHTCILYVTLSWSWRSKNKTWPV